jgi:hypothetical protein
MIRGPARQDANVLEVANGAEDRLLSGDLKPEETPAYCWIATAVANARGPAVANELVDEAALVAAMAATVRQQQSRTPSAGRTWSVQKKAATIVVSGLVVFGSTGVAAAARGSLPGPTQDLVAHVASHLQLNLPTTGDQPTKDAGRHQRTTTDSTAALVTTTRRPAATSTSSKGSPPSSFTTTTHTTTTHTTTLTHGTTTSATSTLHQTTSNKPSPTAPPQKLGQAPPASSNAAASKPVAPAQNAHGANEKSKHADQPKKNMKP